LNRNFAKIILSAQQRLKLFGQYLQLDLFYFLRGGLWLTIPQVIAYLLGIVRSIAFANLAAQVVYGQYNFVLSIVGVFAIFTLPGMNIALTEATARGNYAVLSEVTWVRIKWGAVSTLLCSAVAFYYLLIEGEDKIALAIFMAGLLVPFINGFSSVQSYYNGLKRFDLSSLISFGLSILNTTSLILLLWLQQGLVVLILANLGVQLVFLWIFYRREVRSLPVTQKPDPNVIHYGWSLTWANAINGVALYLDQIIIGFSIGFVELSIYKIATIIPEAIKGVMKMTGTLVFPKIAEKPDKQVYSRLTRYRLGYSTVANVVVVVILILLAPFVITMIYPKYSDSIVLTQLLLLSLIFGWPATFFLTALQARKKIRAIYRYNLLSGILQIGALLILIPFLGVMGAVLSRLIVRWGTTLYLWYEARRL